MSTSFSCVFPCYPDHSRFVKYPARSQEGTVPAYYSCHLTDGRMELDDLYVLPPYRGQGVGTKIIQKCIAETSLPLFLYVFTRNRRAAALYECMGFRTVQKIGRNRLLMEHS